VQARENAVNALVMAPEEFRHGRSLSTGDTANQVHVGKLAVGVSVKVQHALAHRRYSKPKASHAI
jgi:hypothetical protein